MFSLPVANWWRLFIWLGIGFIIYFSYSRNHTVMAKIRAKDSANAEAASAIQPEEA